MIAIAIFIIYIIPCMAFWITAIICIFSKSMRDSIKTPFFVKDLLIIFLFGGIPIVNFISFMFVFGEYIFGKWLDKEL